MKEEKRSIDILDIVDLIYTDHLNRWSLVLKKISDLFESDDAFFVANENNRLICHSSNEDMFCDYNTEEQESVGYLTINGEDKLSIKDYAAFEKHSLYWIDRGLKSVLSVPIVYDEKKFGVLEVVYFSKHVDFKKEDILILEKIAKIISFVLQCRQDKKKYEQTMSIEFEQIKLIHENRIPKTYKDQEFTQWIKDYLKKVLNVTSAATIGFSIPKQDIYVALSRKDDKHNIISYSKTKEVKDLITYKIWEKQILETIILEDLKDLGIELSDFARYYDVRSALFVPIKVNGKVIAVFAFGFNEYNMVAKDYQTFLQTVAMHIMFIVNMSENITDVSSLLSETEERFIESFVLMMEARDTYTKGHSQRVAFYAKKIAEELNLDEKEQVMLYAAGLIHDIGKIGVPDAILLKPGILTQEERKIIQYHPEFSYQIIKNINRFKDVAECVRYHHERCDGSGYPKGLKCSEIPIGAKILAMADVFDALTTSRPYRNALSLERVLDAMRYMKNQFDKDILERALPVLADSFIFKNMNECIRDFMPKEIDNIRMEIFTKDYMTGLLKRKTFIESVESAIEKGERFVMFYVDIKELSSINYKYSMDIGDKVILYTAEVLKNTKHIKFLARTDADVFYFIYFGKTQPELLSVGIKNRLKKNVVYELARIEMELDGWENIIDFYVSFSEFVPGKSVEDMMYECQNRKKEVEDMINDR